jgi:G:T-mismatch repair DNA endonuclease (very short patch repair protein)
MQPPHLIGSSHFPNNLEQFGIKHLGPLGFEYVGDGSFWVTPKGTGKNLNPDFIRKSDRTVVELFGEYWHRNSNPEKRIKLFGIAGWTCHVFWESEFRADVSSCLDKIQGELNCLLNFMPGT